MQVWHYAGIHLRSDYSMGGETSVMAARRISGVTTPVRFAMIGCGGMARHHATHMLRHQDMTEVSVVCEPSRRTYEQYCELFSDAGVKPPPNEPDFDRLLARFSGELDAAFIITPHVYHHDQATACLESGLDVLLEKPMVMSAAEALSLIETRDRTGRLLVVSFNGSLSPQIRTAVEILSGGAGQAAQYPRRRLAELERSDREHLAPGAGHLRRRVPLRHRRPYAEHRCRPGR